MILIHLKKCYDAIQDIKQVEQETSIWHSVTMPLVESYIKINIILH